MLLERGVKFAKEEPSACTRTTPRAALLVSAMAVQATACRRRWCGLRFVIQKTISLVNLIWYMISQQRMLSWRSVSIEYDSPQPQFRPGAPVSPVNTQEICFINVN